MNNKKEEKKCCKCGEGRKGQTKLRKLKDGYYCTKCNKEKRDKRRDHLLHDVLGVRRRKDLMKEWKEKRDLRKTIERRSAKPLIKSIRNKGRVKVLGMWLSKDERLFLYQKYIKKGLDSIQANKKIKNSVEHLNKLVTKMRGQKKTDKEINVKFKEEFAKLCEDTK